MGAGLGALYYKKGTGGEGERGVGDGYLVVLVADGDGLMDHAGHEWFLMLILRLLEGTFAVVSQYQFVLILIQNHSSHLDQNIK